MRQVGFADGLAVGCERQGSSMAPRSWATGRMELPFIEGEDSGKWEDLGLEGEGRQEESCFRHAGLRWLSPPSRVGGYCGWMYKCRVWGGHRSGEVHLGLNNIETGSREFPGSPVVRSWCFHCRGPGSIPGWGTKIPQNKTKKRERDRIESCETG